jgi:hypothetical protein
MADSTTAARRIRRGDVITPLLRSIDDCDVFREALLAFENASADVRARHDEDSPRHAAAVALDRAAHALVTAAADYFCVHSLYDILSALDAEGLEADRKEVG